MLPSVLAPLDCKLCSASPTKVLSADVEVSVAEDPVEDALAKLASNCA